MLGEHGDTGFIAWSNIRIGNLPIEKWIPDFTDQAKEDFRVAVRDAAYSIIEKKGSTSYGVASALARITRAIFRNENAVLPVSAYMDGSHYEIEDVYLGTPAVIGREGINTIAEVPLNEKEKAELTHSANTLKKIIADSFTPLNK